MNLLHNLSFFFIVSITLVVFIVVRYQEYIVIIGILFFTDKIFAVELPATPSISDELKISREKIFMVLL